ncbi:unnamed protein product, partial [Amoebophrya sp. A120]
WRVTVAKLYGTYAYLFTEGARTSADPQVRAFGGELKFDLPFLCGSGPDELRVQDKQRAWVLPPRSPQAEEELPPSELEQRELECKTAAMQVMSLDAEAGRDLMQMHAFLHTKVNRTPSAAGGAAQTSAPNPDPREFVPRAKPDLRDSHPSGYWRALRALFSAETTLIQNEWQNKWTEVHTQQPDEQAARAAYRRHFAAEVGDTAHETDLFDEHRSQATLDKRTEQDWTPQQKTRQAQAIFLLSHVADHIDTVYEHRAGAARADVSITYPGGESNVSDLSDSRDFEVEATCGRSSDANNSKVFHENNNYCVRMKVVFQKWDKDQRDVEKKGQTFVQKGKIPRQRFDGIQTTYFGGSSQRTWYLLGPGDYVVGLDPRSNGQSEYEAEHNMAPQSAWRESSTPSHAAHDDPAGGENNTRHQLERVGQWYDRRAASAHDRWLYDDGQRRKRALEEDMKEKLSARIRQSERTLIRHATPARLDGFVTSAYSESERTRFATRKLWAGKLKTSAKLTLRQRWLWYGGAKFHESMTGAVMPHDSFFGTSTPWMD